MGGIHTAHWVFPVQQTSPSPRELFADTQPLGRRSGRPYVGWGLCGLSTGDHSGFPSFYGPDPQPSSKSGAQALFNCFLGNGGAAQPGPTWAWRLPSSPFALSTPTSLA